MVKASRDVDASGNFFINNNSSIVRCFYAFLKSPQFTSWTAGIRARIVSFVTTHEDSIYTNSSKNNNNNNNGSSSSSFRNSGKRTLLSYKGATSLGRSPSGDHRSTFRTIHTFSTTTTTTAGTSSHHSSMHEGGGGGGVSSTNNNNSDKNSDNNSDNNNNVDGGVILCLPRRRDVAEVHVDSILKQFRGQEYSSIVRSQSWLATLCVACECVNIPIAVLRCHERSSNNNSNSKQGSSSSLSGHRIVYSNPALHTLTGYSKTECYQQPGHFMTRIPEELEYLASNNSNNDVDSPYEPCYSGEDFSRFNGWLEECADVCVPLQMFSRDGKTRRIQLVSKTIRDCETKNNRYIVALYIDPMRDVFSLHNQPNSGRAPLGAELASAHAKLICEPLLHILSNAMSTEC